MDKDLNNIMNTKVSIIMPVWKEAKYIKKSIESVISQTFSEWELIIIDDGLYDNAKNEITKYIQKDNRIILLKNEKNLGIQKTLNRGLRESKGEYIARIDDDDSWIDQDKLKKQVRFLDEKKDYVLVGTRVIFVDENNKELNRSLPFETDEDIKNNLLFCCCFIHSSVVFRKKIVLEEYGGYSEDEEARHSEDHDLWLRICSKYRSYIQPCYSTSYMVRDGSICGGNRLRQIENGIRFTKKYKDKYPNYFKSIMKNYLRLFIYKFIFKKSIRVYLNNIKSKFIKN